MNNTGSGNDNAASPVLNIVVPIRVNMYEHQKAAVGFAVTRNETALLMEQGTGKTLVALAIMGARFRMKEIKDVLIVAPHSVIPVWKQEIHKFAGFPIGLVDLTHKRNEERFEVFDKLADFGAKNPHCLRVGLINYESTWRFYHGLLQWNPDMIICDESQKIKHYKAKQSKAMHLLGDRAKYKLILTGTPVTQSPLDFWSQYRFLNKNIFGENFFKFRGRYAVMGGWMGKQVIGYRHLEDLAEKAHSIAYRVTKAEALDLPEWVDQELYVELEGDARRRYSELKKNFETLLASGESVTVPIVLTQLLRLQQITGGFVKNDLGEIEQISKAKLNECIDILDDLPRDKKVVIFCRFLPEIRAIMKAATNRSSLLLTGDTVDRGFLIKQFQESKDFTLLIAQIQTGGLGVTLTAADTVIFYSTTFGYADYEQARARVHRIGQTQHVTYIHLLAENTIDEDILAALREKRDVAEYVVDKLRTQPSKVYIGTRPI